MSSDVPGQNDGDQEAPLGPGRGLSVFEQLLLALIDAHSNGDENPVRRAQRLDQAVLAVTGRKRTSGPLPGDEDEKALLFMANEQNKDKVAVFDYEYKRMKGVEVPEKPPKIRSDLNLANLAAAKHFTSSDPKVDNSVVNRLREKFRGTYQRKLKGGSNVQYPQTYIHAAVEHDYVTETLERQSLDRILNELKQWGVPSSTERL